MTEVLEDGLYIGPIRHDPIMCKPDRCPGPTGCWCADCESGQHPAKIEDQHQDLSELEKRWLWGDR